MECEDVPNYPSPFKLGQKLNLKSHWFNQKGGGTVEGGAIAITVSKFFWDYECGWRFHGKPVTKGPEKVYFFASDVIQNA